MLRPTFRFLTVAFATTAIWGCGESSPNPVEPDGPDFRVGQGGKVDVCHIPPGSGNAGIISVSANAVDAHLAHGDALAVCLIITEVMYDPTLTSDARGEYVELYNPSDESVDLRSSFWVSSSLKITDASGSAPDHFLSLDGNYPLTVPPKGFAVVYDGGSGSDVPSVYSIPADAVQAKVDDSAIGNGLNNSGDTVTLLTADLSIEIDSTSYDGSLANNNGLSLQRCDGTFIEASPTPGAPNAC